MTDVTPNDRTLDSIRRITASEIRAVVGYPGTYDYRIVSATTEELSADPADDSIGLPGVNHVPLRASTIGRVTPSPGTRCHIIFLDGNRRKPVCTWVEADEGLPVGRTGDSVQVTIPANSFLVAANAGVLNPVPVTVDGQITGGSSRVTSE